jgi:hypothetical protein
MNEVMLASIQCTWAAPEKLLWSFMVKVVTVVCARKLSCRLAHTVIVTMSAFDYDSDMSGLLGKLTSFQEPQKPPLEPPLMCICSQ